MSYYFVKVKNDHGHPYDWSYGIPGGSHSYTDYHSLVRLSGCPTIELADCDLESDHTYICAPWNGNATAHFSRPHKCRVIHWDIERPGIEPAPGADETWVSDMTQLTMHKGKNVKYVVLGGHPDLGGSPAYPKLWDAAVLCYLCPRRSPMIYSLLERGVLVAPSTHEFEEKKRILSHSRFGLMLFQDDHPIVTPLRAVLYACSKLPIVAETVGDSFPYKLLPFDPDGRFLSLDPTMVAASVEHNYKMATQIYPFRETVEAAL